MSILRPGRGLPRDAAVDRTWEGSGEETLEQSQCHLLAFSLWRGELGRPGEGVDDISISSEMINKVEAQVMQWD